MSKKPNELKNALQSLKVSEALRLSKGTATKDFAFKPPEPSEIKPIPDQKNLSPSPTENAAISAQNNPRSNDALLDSSSERRDPRLERAEIGKSRDGRNLRSKQAEMDSRPVKKPVDGFDVTPFAPNVSELELFEHGDGAFHIPHKIYEFVHKAVDTKVELLVFNCLLRYTLGFQRATCQASQSFISRWTGIAAPNVRKALRSLIERKFIRRLEEGTISHDSAVYELPLVTAYLAYDRSRKLTAAFKKSEIERRLDENVLRSNQPAISDQIERGSEIESIPKKERENKNGNKTLSPTTLVVLEKYFSELAPKQKRERELKAFQDLKGQFEVSQIERALVFVQKYGALEDKAPVHSPMAYLALSIRDVLKYAQEEDAALKRRRDAEQRQALELQARKQQEERETEEFQRKEQAFFRTFPSPDRQEEFIQKICSRQEFGWKPQGQIARSIAIQAWWDELGVQERKSLEVV